MAKKDDDGLCGATHSVLNTVTAVDSVGSVALQELWTLWDAA